MWCCMHQLFLPFFFLRMVSDDSSVNKRWSTHRQMSKSMYGFSFLSFSNISGFWFRHFVFNIKSSYFLGYYQDKHWQHVYSAGWQLAGLFVRNNVRVVTDTDTREKMRMKGEDEWSWGVEIENKKESEGCGEMWALCPGSVSIDPVSGPKRCITNPPPAFSSSIFPLMSSPSPSSFFLLHSAIHFSALYPGLAVSRARKKIKIYIPCCLLSPPAILKSQNISLSLSI